ncbi:MAG TPA: glucose-6-phosphate dehydrogenase, partial [Nocardioides sp.]|nr:glucose-6-phosphate dehydrogenase [Nocardioides sp.]
MSETTSDVLLPSCDFVVVGGTGDLALRKLFPGLLHREIEGQLPGDTRLIGVSRSPIDDDGYRDLIRAALTEHVPGGDPAALERLLERVHHLTLDAAAPEDWHLLAGMLKRREDPDAVRVYYLAVAPQVIDPICQRLDELGLVTQNCRVVVEKPIGTDLASSRRINDAVGRVFEERQIYRIDHYLGKESVQNLLVTRFANTFLEPLWTSRWVDHVQITAS